MIRNKLKFRRRRVAGVLWFAGVLGSLLLYWWIMANFVIRDFWDPPYAVKAEYLRARVDENPQRPLWVVMGSSRVEFGLQPGVLEQRPGDKNTPMIFNLGLAGVGIFREFIYLRRVLEDGFKPQVAGIEIFEADMNHEMHSTLADPALLVRARGNELEDYLRYSRNPPDFVDEWKRSRWNPGYKYGMRMEHQTRIWRLLPIPGIGHLEEVFYDKWGWVSSPATTPPDEYRDNFVATKNAYKDDFANFNVSPEADSALRKILEMCAKAGIKVFLLKMPESEDFRALHTGRTDERLAAYIKKIQGEYAGVPLVDASTWVEKEGFSDGHHMNAAGGAEFSRRLGDELRALKW